MFGQHLKISIACTFHVYFCFFLSLVHKRKILIMLIKHRDMALPFARNVADVFIDSLESRLSGAFTPSVSGMFLFTHLMFYLLLNVLFNVF